MNNSYMTQAEADVLNNLMPGNQNLGVGNKLKRALSTGFRTKDGQTFYVDGTNGSDSLNDGLSWETAYKTIQKAVDSCGNGRGDVIYVAPMVSAKYTENVLIMDHQAIKIIAPWGPWNTRLRVSDATTKYAVTPVGGQACAGIGFVCLSRNVEISGFTIDGGGGYCGVYVGDGYNIDATWNENSAGCNINNCMFVDASKYGIILDGCSANVVIENNIIERFVNAGIYIAPGGSRTVQRPIIRYNEFLGTGYGIQMYSHATTVAVLVRGNSFYDITAASMTNPCLFAGAGVHAYVGNLEATANRMSGSATDIMSGNFYGGAGNAHMYVAEA